MESERIGGSGVLGEDDQLADWVGEQCEGDSVEGGIVGVVGCDRRSTFRGFDLGRQGKRVGVISHRWKGLDI